MTEEIEIPLASTDKYEEALAKARFEYEKNPCASESEKRLLEIIFPELAESEDERIRRFLVELVSNDKLIDFGGLYKVRNVLYDDVLTYLEKQKGVEAEIEKAYKNADKIQYERGFEDGVASVKPVEWNEVDYDEEIADLCDGSMSLTSKDIARHFYELGQRCHKPTEWSKEDEDKVAQYLHDKDGGMLWSKATEIAEDILGMIRPQPHWKPSERQMRDLATLAKQNEGNSLGNDLISLYNDLKKL